MYIIKTISKNGDSAPTDMYEGELVFAFDDKTKIRVTKPGPSGAYSVNIEAEEDVDIDADSVNMQGTFMTINSATAVNINAGSDINLNSGPSGSVYIDGQAFENHTHDYSWTDNSGSGTTNTPN